MNPMSPPLLVWAAHVPWPCALPAPSKPRLLIRHLTPASFLISKELCDCLGPTLIIQGRLPSSQPCRTRSALCHMRQCVRWFWELGCDPLGEGHHSAFHRTSGPSSFPKDCLLPPSPNATPYYTKSGPLSLLSPPPPQFSGFLLCEEVPSPASVSAAASVLGSTESSVPSLSTTAFLPPSPASQWIAKREMQRVIAF